MHEIYMMMIVASVPLSLIGAVTYIQSLRYKAKRANGLSEADKQLLVNILKDNKSLRDRLSNMEEILTSLDTDVSELKALNKTTLTEEEARKLLESKLQ